MDITITGRNFDVDEPLKRYIYKRLTKLARLYNRIYKCEVILEEEKVRKNIEIILHLKRNRLIAKESSTDMYTSVDNAAGKIKTQLRKLNGRISSKRRARGVLGKMVSRFKSAEDMGTSSERGEIIRTSSFADKPMLPEEAKYELELTNRNFIMFKNANTGKANVLYKRGDGNYGLIEPDF